MCDKKLYYPVTFRFSLIIHFSFLMSITSRFVGFRKRICGAMKMRTTKRLIGEFGIRNHAPLNKIGQVKEWLYIANRCYATESIPIGFYPELAHVLKSFLHFVLAP